MELLLISENVLKISLSKTDMENYSLSSDNIDYNNTETRKAFWSILDEAKHKTGFDAASNKISIQIFTSRSGGCDMFVSKTDSTETKSDSVVNCKVSREEKNKKQYIYYFDSGENLISACRCLEKMSFGVSGKLYSGENKGYYLCFSEKVYSSGKKTRKKETISKYDFLSEYGYRCSADDEKFLSEHNKLICEENAVSTISKL